MTDLTVSRPGQVNLSGDVDAIFLKIFAGEVLTVFDETNVMATRHTVRSIASGKSASFPATWKGTAHYHTPGTMLVGSTVAANERILIIDDLLVADRALASIDEAKAHFDVRSIYSHDIGQALANTMDRQLLQVAVLAARAHTTVVGGNGGSRIISGTMATTVATLEAGAFSAAQALDEKDVPSTDRYLFLAPAQYNLLVSGSSKVINGDYNRADNGGFATGVVKQIAGMEIVKTNHLPRTNVTTGPTAYRGNFTTNTAVAMHKSAIGTVKLIDLSVESSWQTLFQAWFLVGRYAMGHGILRPEAAVELCTAATS